MSSLIYNLAVSIHLALACQSHETKPLPSGGSVERHTRLKILMAAIFMSISEERSLTTSSGRVTLSLICVRGRCDNCWKIDF
ncbi:hypothetical protein RRG08_029447 [Elysia crispata]|uniref:Secreted protein n=1 Tax=Elysia crispata TaxID=231223 RepID=A0AAE1BD15_9GAST|nr:hypothetical protein RRG08_029447 [Elysia crispata]